MGNTFNPSQTGFSGTVHPHACGEHISGFCIRGKSTGSSPRLWGTPMSQRHLFRCPRFIPTPVGNTSSIGTTPPRRPVHPHACGEHAFQGRWRPGCRGSSPRLWGTPGFVSLGDVGERFIPTPVGNTSPNGFSPWFSPVHPHACGEHVKSRQKTAGGGGSSPRLWGTRRNGWEKLPKMRFIPTPVGNTLPGLWAPVNPPVHPHACGEHGLAAVFVFQANGSSPRLWGTLFDRVCGPGPARFIPTPVGNTTSRWQRRALPSVHPHACGEHSSWNLLKLGRFIGGQYSTGVIYRAKTVFQIVKEHHYSSLPLA